METTPTGVASGVVLGAEAISDRIFGGELTPKQVYRLAEEGSWPIFRIRGKLACFPDSMLAHMKTLEEQAVSGGRAA